MIEMLNRQTIDHYLFQYFKTQPDTYHDKQWLRWVLLAMSKDDARPSLECAWFKLVDIKEEKIFYRVMASDGFRVHTATIQLPIRITENSSSYETHLRDGGYWVHIRGEYLILKWTDAVYPDLVAPYAMLAKLKPEPVDEVKLSARYLCEAMSMPGIEPGMDKFNPPCLYFYGPNQPVLVERVGVKGYRNGSAVIMPMQMTDIEKAQDGHCIPS